MGVIGMDLPASHHVVGMCTARDDLDLVCVTSGGYGKRTRISEYRKQSRGGMGIITIKDAPDRGDLVAVCPVHGNHELVLVTQEGTVIRVPVKGISTMGRNTMGVRIMKLSAGDRVSSVARVVAESDPGDDEDLDTGGQLNEPEGSTH